MLFVIIATTGGFYAIDTLQAPWILLLLAVLVSIAALLLRWHRLFRHKRAHRVEYNRASLGQAP
jgi:hypothetical protein